MPKHVNLVDLVKSFPTNIYLQNLASIQKRASPIKFADLAEKSGKGLISNLSTKVGVARQPGVEGKPPGMGGSGDRFTGYWILFSFFRVSSWRSRRKL